MKNKIILTIVASLLLISAVTVYAISSFSFDSSKLSFSASAKTDKIKESLDEEYTLKLGIKEKEEEDPQTVQEIKDLSRRITLLLFGDFNNKNETTEHLYKRRKEFFSYMYDPEIPRTEDGELDSDSQEYSDSTYASITISSYFKYMVEVNPIYNSIESIEVRKLQNGSYAARVIIKDCKIKEDDETDPMRYVYKSENIIIFYTFKLNVDKWQLYHISADTTDDLSKFVNTSEEKESKESMSILSNTADSISSMYNTSKMDNASDESIKEIYANNEKNLVTLSSYYNTSIVAQGNRFMINDGIVITTWDFLNDALLQGQFITIKNGETKYEVDGIVTINPSTDIAVIKLKEKTGTFVELAKREDIKSEDLAVTITSKTGVGYTTLKSIVTGTQNYIETSTVLSKTDRGSIVLNENGKVIGMNTAKSINSSFAKAIGPEVLQEVQDMFKDKDFNTIKATSFEELKEKYYYENINEEIRKNDISESKWKKYSQIGKIEETIDLELVKASYKDSIVSLRYKNGLSDFISSMQLATSFEEKLISEGYTQTLKSDKKDIYENNKYQVIIMDELEYLIIVMVKK